MKRIILMLLLIATCVPSFAGTIDRNLFTKAQESRIIGENGQFVAVSEESASNIDLAHRKVHDGLTFRVCTMNIDVADGASLNIVIKPSYESHFTAAIVTEGKAYIYFYKSPTHSGGVTQNIINMNDTSTLTSTAVVTANPTVTAVGTYMCSALNPGGIGPQSLGSEARTGTELILAAGTEYLLSIVNMSGQAKDLNANVQWYEERE